MVGAFEQTLLAIMMAFIMLGMGAALTPQDFKSSLRRPFGLFVGLVSQYGLLPLIGFTLALLLPLSPEVKIGLIIMSCMPGGTTSNIFTYFAKGNLALSMLMTVNSTMFGVVLIPLLIVLYAAGLGISVPADNIVRTLIVLLVPVAIGMALRRWNANVGAIVELAGGALGIFFLLFIAVSWVPRNWQFLLSTPPSVYAAVIGLGLLGFLFGYLFSALLKLHPINAQTISMEVGIQNGPLALAIVALSFTGLQQQQIIAVPALYSLFIVINASLLTIWYRRINDRSRQKLPDSLL
ncbi:MAG: bile acid:sodium symporter family protein [Hyphomicrobiales bacterium]|jgi:bile acid:Na+ symporter, BASS family|nr:bile acid:sodium symporter family protein [Hyphomicrobiales bacterium]